MLNAVEPGTVIPIHRHPTKDESFVVLRGKVRCTTYKDDGSVAASHLCLKRGWMLNDTERLLSLWEEYKHVNQYV